MSFFPTATNGMITPPNFKMGPHRHFAMHFHGIFAQSWFHLRKIACACVNFIFWLKRFAFVQKMC
jgi:hypothetical protein